MAKENNKENVMRDVKIERLVLSCSSKENLDKSVKLLEIIANRKVRKTKAKKRIPTFGISPDMEIGCMVTIRKDVEPLLKRLLEAINNKLRVRQIKDNHFSFGIKEYIEIPGLEYRREIGILGLNVTIIFSRKGKRIEIRKIKKGKLPKKQTISKDEIINFMKNKFNTEIR